MNRQVVFPLITPKRGTPSEFKQYVKYKADGWVTDIAIKGLYSFYKDPNCDITS